MFYEKSLERPCVKWICVETLICNAIHVKAKKELNVLLASERKLYWSSVLRPSCCGGELGEIQPPASKHNTMRIKGSFVDEKRY